MSVINTMLKDLDKRQKLQDDGVYHPSEHKSNMTVYILAGTVAVLAGVIGCGFWYYSNKSVATPDTVTLVKKTDSTVSSVNTATVADEHRKEALQKPETVSPEIREQEDEQTLAALEDEIYGPDEPVQDPADSYEQLPEQQPAVAAVSRNTAPAQVKDVPPARKVMKVTPIELTREQETELDVKAANIALSQGNIDKAIESYMSILSRDQKNRQAREKIASLYFGTNNISQAKKVLQQGIGLDPAYPNYRLLLARILMDQGARTEALSVLTSLSLRAESGNLDYIATEASLATELNQPAIAIDAYSKLTRIMPNDGKWWFGLGLSFDRQNMKSAAVTNYKRAIDVGVAEASRKFALQRIQELEK